MNLDGGFCQIVDVPLRPLMYVFGGLVTDGQSVAQTVLANVDRLLVSSLFLVPMMSLEIVVATA